MYFDQYDQYGQYAQYAQYYLYPYLENEAGFAEYPDFRGYQGYADPAFVSDERQVTGQAGQQLVNFLLQQTIAGTNPRVEAIMQIFLTRRRDVLRLIENYGVPPRISQALTRQIIVFVINNAQPGVNIPQQVQRLVNQFYRQDQLVIPILRFFRVPDFVIRQYITRVIRITLRNLIFIPGQNIEREVNELLRLFEQRFPNFLGLTNVYNVPVRVARDIVRDIIRFTLLNAERISPFGTIQQRAQEMVNLIMREQPELIRVMRRYGVPANQADDIARRIVIFTLREAGFDED